MSNFVPMPNRPPWKRPQEYMLLFTAGALLTLLVCAPFVFLALAFQGLITMQMPPELMLKRTLQGIWAALTFVADPVLIPGTRHFWWTLGGWTIAGSAGTVGMLSAIFLMRPPANPTHIRGRDVSEDPTEADADLEPSRRRSGEGLWIHDDVQMSLDLETKHILLVGATGSGKTTILAPLMCEAIDRGDLCLIYDPKPDFTSWIPGKPAIMAPWDKRGLAWDMAADVLDSGDAETLAARLIPESKDPMWSDGARAILQAAIMDLQAKMPDRWGPVDLLRILSDDDEIYRVVREQLPLSQRLVEDMESKTTQSLMITLSAQLKSVQNLAIWYHGKPRFSFRRWLLRTGTEAKKRTLILGANDRYSELARAYVQSIISICTSIICSPDFGDSKKRRVWLFLDELPQLGKITELSKLLAVGRSKGIRMVCGAQDISQLRDIYGQDQAQAWASMFGCWIIAQVKGEASPKWISELLGEKEFWRYGSNSSRDLLTGAISSVSDSWTREKEPVIPPDELTDTLGPEDDGIRAILYVPGLDTIYRLLWPYHLPAQVRKINIPYAPPGIAAILAESDEVEEPKGGGNLIAAPAEPKQPEPEPVEEKQDPQPEPAPKPTIKETEAPAAATTASTATTGGLVSAAATPSGPPAEDEKRNHEQEEAADSAAEIAGGALDTIADATGGIGTAIEITQGLAAQANDGSGSGESAKSLAEDIFELFGDDEEQEA